MSSRSRSLISVRCSWPCALQPLIDLSAVLVAVRFEPGVDLRIELDRQTVHGTPDGRPCKEVIAQLRDLGGINGVIGHRFEAFPVTSLSRAHSVVFRWSLCGPRSVGFGPLVLCRLLQRSDVASVRYRSSDPRLVITKIQRGQQGTAEHCGDIAEVDAIAALVQSVFCGIPFELDQPAYFFPLCSSSWVV